MAAGRSIEDLPFRSPLGLYGSYFALLLVAFMLVLTFYVALIPPGGSPNAQYFFQNWLSGPIALTAFGLRKVWTRDWTLGVKINDMDIDTGRRDDSYSSRLRHEEEKQKTFSRRVVNAIF